MYSRKRLSGISPWRRNALLLACLCLTLIGVPSRLLAQHDTGAIAGRVTDPAGALVPGAKITATEVDKTLTYQAETNGAGEFVISALPIGRYTVRIEKDGFDAAEAGPFDVNLQQQVGEHYRPNTSAIEAERIGLRIIRNAVGDNVILDKDGSPMLAPVGLVDAGRLSNDTEHSFQGTFDAATGIAARFYMNRNFYVADPDDFCVSNERSPDPQWDELKPVTFEEAKAAITLSAMAGGMFEIGDDLPSLAKEPERLALVTNPELLKLMRLSRSATPLDLMTYDPQDLQPSLFWVRESDRQGLLAIFNWTESNRKHQLSLAQLGLSGAHWEADEVFGGQGIKVAGASVEADQPAHSVRLIRLVNEKSPATAPQVVIESRSHAQIGQAVEFKATVQTTSNPILGYSWSFGDGTRADGAAVTHTFTHDGPFNVTVHAQSLDGPVSTAAKPIEIQGTLKTGFSASDLPTD
jgi:alpha-galactosidase